MMEEILNVIVIIAGYYFLYKILEKRLWGGRMTLQELNKALGEHPVGNDVFVVINIDEEEKTFDIDGVTSYDERVFIELGDEV